MNSKRIEAVDVLRGITMVFMILVNNPGDWGRVYAPLRHAEWNGMTPTDCIFPVFLFLMGYSIFLSFRKSGFRLTGPRLWKILRRTLLLFGIGLLLAAPGALLGGGPLRVMGVLQRFALCYLATALLACLVDGRWLPWVAGGLLAVYTVLLLVGNGFAQDTSNVLARVDLAVLGDHVYKPGRLDPEGLLSTLPAIAHTLIGFCAARWSLGADTREEGGRRLLLLGAALLLGGLVLQYGCPLNKNVWSPTFVMVTCGVGCLLLGLLAWAIDEKRYWRHTGFWKVFGTNSILCYVLSFVLSYVLSYVRVGGDVLGGWLNAGMVALFGPGELSSLMYAVALVLLIWALVYPLYRKHIFIKL